MARHVVDIGLLVERGGAYQGVDSSGSVFRFAVNSRGSGQRSTSGAKNPFYFYSSSLNVRLSRLSLRSDSSVFASHVCSQIISSDETREFGVCCRIDAKSRFAFQGDGYSVFTGKYLFDQLGDDSDLAADILRYTADLETSRLEENEDGLYAAAEELQNIYYDRFEISEMFETADSG